MTGTRWHLPAVDMRAPGAITVDTATPGHTQTMVSACGKRGPMRPRESIGGLSVQLRMAAFDEDPLVCWDCMVLWDKAEEDGTLLVRWVSDFSPTWRGPGAVLFSERPERQPCRKCRLSTGSVGRDYVPLACIPRGKTR